MITPKTNLQYPCLCGSGRKYKNCCWPVEKRTYAIARQAVAETHQVVIEYALVKYPKLRDIVTREYFRKLEKRHGANAVEEFNDRFAEAIEIKATTPGWSDSISCCAQPAQSPWICGKSPRSVVLWQA